MPLGLHGDVATFQCLMDHVLALHAEYTATYINDIVIFKQYWAHHKQTLVVVLTELRKACLTVNPRKCAVAQRQTKYLRILVGQGTIKPLADKVEAVSKFQALQTCKQLQSFLGLTNYLPLVFPWFSELAAPLSEALKGP